MSERALVLGGGGVTGIAWELGILSGLAAAGIDLRVADAVIGTSAGSVVGAQITSGADLDELYEAQLVESGNEVAAKLGVRVMGGYAWAMLRERSPQQFRRRLGAMALRRRTVPESARKAVIASRLPQQTWPGGNLRVAAIDTGSGEFVTFHRDSGVALVDAVAASCAVPLVWPPVTIDGRRFMDGGLRSPANVDLAAGYSRVVVIAPLVRGGGQLTPVAAQVAELRRSGARVAVISPDAAAMVAIGRNVLDPARKAGAARAGRAQAATVADETREVWSA
ncbi:patatin-like phospholipase family protein [Micromonospora sp. NPDC049679]|uniref:patatin-like phospholipase family protein n=1 Tax=Micromonospora sp. NPDC049679 TaxID=3155920 RepID=UPI0033F0A52F